MLTCTCVCALAFVCYAVCCLFVELFMLGQVESDVFEHNAFLDVEVKVLL